MLPIDRRRLAAVRSGRIPRSIPPPPPKPKRVDPFPEALKTMRKLSWAAKHDDHRAVTRLEKRIDVLLGA